MEIKLDLRLRDLVRQAYKDCHGNWSALAADIHAAYTAGTAPRSRKKGSKPNTLVVDRRKLTRLAAAKSVSDEGVQLSLKELSALQAYFVHKRQLRLNDNLIFDHPQSLLSGFDDATDITVFLPTRHLQSLGTDCASSWDMQAFEHLLRAQQLAEARVDLEDVFHYGAKSKAEALRRKVTNEPWYKKLRGRPVISIGSPFVNYATEQLLCWMCDLGRPYESTRQGPALPVPFRFFWPHPHSMSQSAFGIGKRELKAEFADSVKELDADERGLIVGDDWYPAHRKHLSHDLIVAQRYSGNFILVLSAIHAPATLGIARMIAKGKVPISRAGTHRDTDFLHIAVARTEFEEQPTDEDIPRDWRQLIDTKLVGQPRVWDRNRRVWVD